MEFRDANTLLYRGYLYLLILVIVAIAAVIVTVLAVILPLSSSPSALAPAVALPLLAGEVVVFIIAGVLIFFLYLFRGYMALHKLGIGWAWWMAWGPIIEAVLEAPIVVLALAALTHAQSIGRGSVTGGWIWSILASARVMLIILGAFGLFLAIAHILFLSNMYRHTAIKKFNTAFILLIIGLVLSIPPYIDILGAIILIAQYVIEMLAYKEASEWTPPAPQTPQPSTPA